MYPDRDTLSNVPRSGYITARDDGKGLRKSTSSRETSGLSRENKTNCFPRDLTLRVYYKKYKEHDKVFL